MQAALLTLLIVVVLFLPLFWQKVEENLEVFLFVCGLAAATISGVFSTHLLKEVFTEPLRICAAVFKVGIAFKKFHFVIRRVLHASVRKIGLRAPMFFIVFILGLSSSIITAIVAALILSEVAAELCLKKK